jgi:ribonuclease E
LAPPADSEVEDAVADFNGDSVAPALPEVQPEPIAPVPEPQLAEPSSPEPDVASPAAEPTAAEPAPQETEKASPRRSTVREKVTFLADGQSDSPATGVSPPTPTAEPEAMPPASEAVGDASPRRAGWWSRRFGNNQ